MRENMDQKNSKYKHFLRSETPIAEAYFKFCQISMRNLYLKMVTLREKCSNTEFQFRENSYNLTIFQQLASSTKKLLKWV